MYLIFHHVLNYHRKSLIKDNIFARNVRLRLLYSMMFSSFTWSNVFCTAVFSPFITVLYWSISCLLCSRFFFIKYCLRSSSSATLSEIWIVNQYGYRGIFVVCRVESVVCTPIPLHWRTMTQTTFFWTTDVSCLRTMFVRAQRFH